MQSVFRKLTLVILANIVRRQTICSAEWCLFVLAGLLVVVGWMGDCFGLYGQVTKRARWMPWQPEAMKDVVACDKSRGGGKQPLIQMFQFPSFASQDLCIQSRDN